MTPTNELRFVERYLSLDNQPVRLLRILQQKWVGELHENRAAGKYVDEWRDVPVEKEPKP
jgi:hypothetical protein